MRCVTRGPATLGLYCVVTAAREVLGRVMLLGLRLNSVDIDRMGFCLFQ